MRRPTLLALIAVGLIAAAAGCGSEGGGDAMSDASATAMAATTDDAMQRDAMGSGRAMGDDATKSGAAMSARRSGTLVKVVDSEYGRVLADGKGEAFYLFDKEDAARSECYGACASAWPPVLARGTPRAGTGAGDGLLGTTTRRDGKRQVTYAGHPLYYYVQDSPGTILCHDVVEYGGRWLVVAPSGAART
jgi:predicted lipoprotein with Yx(FWY)xxD motif